MTYIQTSVGFLAKILQALTNSKSAIGKQTLTISGTAQSLTPTSEATSALIQFESAVTTATARYWEDGSVPTSSVGFYQGPGAVIELTSAENIRNFKVIQGVAGAIQLNITYSK